MAHWRLAIDVEEKMKKRFISGAEVDQVMDFPDHEPIVGKNNGTIMQQANVGGRILRVIFYPGDLEDDPDVILSVHPVTPRKKI